MNIKYDYGIVMDAVGVRKYLDPGDPRDMGWTPEYEGTYGIVIERKYGKNIKLLYSDKEERDAAYEIFIEQVLSSSGEEL